MERVNFMEKRGMKRNGQSWKGLVFLVIFGAFLLLPVQSEAAPGGGNIFGVGIEGEGWDPVNIPGADGRWLVGGGVNLQYWFTKNIGVRAGADYLNNTSAGDGIGTDILPFYSGLMVSLFSSGAISLDLFGDFGQALVNGIDNTYFDAGAQLNGPLSSGRQFFLEVRWRQIGTGSYPTPYQFVSAGVGVNIF